MSNPSTLDEVMGRVGSRRVVLVSCLSLAGCGSDRLEDASDPSGDATEPGSSSTVGRDSDDATAGATSGATSSTATVGGGTSTGDATGGDTDEIPAIVSCSPTAPACDAPRVESGSWASFRKDRWLDDEQLYPEAGIAPTAGGRFHIAAIAAVGGGVTDVRIDGTRVEDLLGEPGIEWSHVWPTTLTAGEPVWVAFHSRDAAWDVVTSGQLEISTDQGVAVSASFPVNRASVPLTYITTSDDYSEIIVFVRNDDDVAHELSALIVDGREVYASDVACVPKGTLAPGETARWIVPRCTATTPGAPLTVVAIWEDAPASVGVGRVMPAHFPIEAWSRGSDCSFPGINDESFTRHVEAGFDTQYMYWGGYSNCGFAGAQMLETYASSYPHQRVLLGDDFWESTAPHSAELLPTTLPLAGFLTGDESDGEVYDETGTPNASHKAAEARALWEIAPEVPVYNGAKTNKNVGTFAGMTDIQGMDFYVAACAPHITAFGNHPPVRAAFDYLRNARDNHAPLPTWLYAQGLHGGWNRQIAGITIRRQPQRQEILVQAMSVLAAGGKGLMWFQTSLEEADAVPDSWAAIADFNRLTLGLRDRLRTGDVTGLATSDPATIVEAIRTEDAVMIPIINTAVVSGPTDLQCATVLTADQVPHWVLEERDVSVTITVPDDLAVVDAFEVGPGVVFDLDFPRTIDGRRITVSNIPLSNDTPIRMLVVAANDEVRGDIESNFGDLDRP